jgi:glycine oxidase
VVAVETQGGAAGGVVLASGAIVPAPSIVVSAGARSGELKLPAAIPVRPVKGQLLHLRSREEAPLCRRNVRSPDVYVVPRADGRVVVGATVEEQGFYEPVTGLAVYELLRDSYELLPGILELEFVEVSVGFRPGSPDNAPLIGETEMPGVVLATGHFRNGVLLAPVTADAIAGVLLDGEAPAEAAAFSPRRFSARRREAS